MGGLFFNLNVVMFHCVWLVILRNCSCLQVVRFSLLRYLTSNSQSLTHHIWTISIEVSGFDHLIELSLWTTFDCRVKKIGSLIFIFLAFSFRHSNLTPSNKITNICLFMKKKFNVFLQFFFIFCKFYVWKIARGDENHCAVWYFNSIRRANLTKRNNITSLGNS